MRNDYTEYCSRRKELVKVLGDGLGIKPKYLRVPSCAYEIGAIRITKDCFMECEDEETGRKATEILLQHGFTAAGEAEPDEPAIEPDSMTVSIPEEKLTDEELERVRKMVEAKGAMIKHAIGTDELPIKAEDGKVSFPWFPMPADADEAKAYTELISKLCDLARKQKRVTAYEKDVPNEKYAFRCFLLRLGMIGSEYKTTRKILLRNLNGSSAFRSGHRKEQEECQS